jgi:hypothetical protein
MTLLGARHFKMRHAIALAMMTASFAAGGEAMADCTPAGPVNNTIVTCTGPGGRLRAATRVHLERAQRRREGRQFKSGYDRDNRGLGSGDSKS